jgi:glycosyltransferase involved in cell wall biosynthesis
MLRRAVACFFGQTYRDRELVVLYPADDRPTGDYLAGLGDPSIRPIEVPAGLTTGALRNVALEAARGRYVAMWDDDDWHAPARLAEQIAVAGTAARQGCVLLRLTLYDETTCSAFLSARRTWEGTLVAERGVVPPFPDLARGSDTPVITRLMNEEKLVALDRPDLYIYVYHGTNTWSRAHWDTNLLPYAAPLSPGESARVGSLLNRG